jgi:hypothetical protein
MSAKRCLILGVIGIATTVALVVFACMGVYLLTWLSEEAPPEVPKPLVESDEAKQSPVVTPTPYPTPTATAVRPTATPRPPQYSLALLSMRGSESYGFFIVEGQVKNISGSSLDDVVAVVTVYDANKEFITYDEALIEYTTILAGQTSPFSVYVDYNPAIEWYDVEFKYLLDGTIPCRDDRE